MWDFPNFFYQMSWGVIVNKCVKFQQFRSYLNLQLKIAFKISQPKNRQNLKFCNFQVIFSRKCYQRFSYIFLHLLAVYCCEQNTKKIENLTRILREEGQRNIYPSLLSPLGVWGMQIKLCTLVGLVTFNICMPTEFWARTRSCAQCWLVTR